MYNISVPLINISAKKMGLEKHLKELERLDAKRVFLAIGSYYINDEKRKSEMAALKENSAFFKQHGLEVGAWLWAFNIEEKNEFVHMKGIEGGVSRSEICPSDENFRKFAAGYISDIAKCGVDLIMFDDDFRYCFIDSGCGCLCDNHISYMESLLGEKLEFNNVSEKIVSGGASKYRSAWQESKKHFFELFAKQMRESVNSVNPDIRLGLCSCMSVWDMDGIDSKELSRTLAGNTKPFIRFIGAPYWASHRPWGNRLQNIIELERMQKSWCEDDIEIMCEGDAHPRPRTNCPASYLEIFDTALRASGGFDGILKYAIDYISNPGYEDGYIKRHEKNRRLYSEIEKRFGGKKACGIRVFERMKKFEDMTFSSAFKDKNDVQNVFFSHSAKILADNTIPLIYEGSGICSAAFAENVTIVPEAEMQKGLIIDLRAAEILNEKGIDTGLVSLGEKHRVSREYFDDYDELYGRSSEVYDVKVSENARVLSHYVGFDEKNDEIFRTPSAYYYKNKNGQQFLVFAFKPYDNLSELENEHRGYVYSRLVKDAVSLFGGRLPAYSYGNPDLYIIAKKSDEEMSVGLWNIFADEIIEPEIELDREYKIIEFINCKGKMSGNKVYLSDIAAFGFAGFTVEG